MTPPGRGLSVLSAAVSLTSSTVLGAPRASVNIHRQNGPQAEDCRSGSTEKECSVCTLKRSGTAKLVLEVNKMLVTFQSVNFVWPKAEGSTGDEAEQASADPSLPGLYDTEVRTRPVCLGRGSAGPGLLSSWAPLLGESTHPRALDARPRM